MPVDRAVGRRVEVSSDEQVKRVVARTYKGAVPGDADDQLEQLTEIARVDWPEVALTDAQWAQHVDRHSAGKDRGAWLAEVCASDLYLAAGCAFGLAPALAAFDRSFLSQVPSFVAQVDGQGAFADDVRQALRLRLLVSVGGAEPRIAEYGGLGALLSFVRVAAVRVALNLKRGAHETRATATEDATLEALPTVSDPALDLVRAKYGPAFKEAMREAFRALPTEQREALRLHFAGRFPGHRIATMMGVHRATVTRWLAAARVGVLGGTRRLLQEKLKLHESEIDSLIAVLRSQLDASMSELILHEPDRQR